MYCIYSIVNVNKMKMFFFNEAIALHFLLSFTCSLHVMFICLNCHKFALIWFPSANCFFGNLV